MVTQFPGFGLSFEVSNVAFKVFGIAVYWYGIIIALAFLAAVVLALRSCKDFGISQDTILDGVLIAVPAAIIFARLYYVVLSWDQYKDNLLKIFDTRGGGLAIYGGVIGAALAVLIYAKIKKLSFFGLMDFAAPYIILGQAIGRWGNFINQEAFGSQTQLPWRMNGTYADQYLIRNGLDPAIWGVHPTFLYESLWNIAVFVVLLTFRRKKKLSGEVISLYLILYGIGRFIIEGLRTDSLMLGSIRFSQLLSIVLVLVLIPVFIYRRVKLSKKADKQPAELGQSKYGNILMKMKEEEKAELENIEAVKAEEHSEDNTVDMDAVNEVADEDKENTPVDTDEMERVADGDAVNTTAYSDDRNHENEADLKV